MALVAFMICQKKNGKFHTCHLADTLCSCAASDILRSAQMNASLTLHHTFVHFLYTSSNTVCKMWSEPEAESHPLQCSSYNMRV